MHTSLRLLAFTLYLELAAGFPGFPSFRPPKPSTPEVPNTPKPYSPESPNAPKPYSPKPIGDPTVPNSGPYDPANVPPQQQIQSNMGRVEQRLDKLDIALEIGSAIKDVVDAILQQPEVETFLGETFTVTSAASDVTFTPTSTLPSTSFAACTSYASVIRSCASATSNFYALPATAQASCACYRTAPASYISCGVSSEAWAAVPTLAADALDNAANECHDFFSLQGYKKGASVLSGEKKGDLNITLGDGFCAAVDQELKKGASASANASASGNSTAIPSATRTQTGTRGLAATLQPTQPLDCKAVASSNNQPTTGAGVRVATFTGFDRAILVSAYHVSRHKQ